MRFIVKRITPFLLYGADGGKDLLCKGNHKPTEQTQEALRSLACVMALDRHTDLDNAPAEDNNADSLDRGKDKVRHVVDHRDRVAAGGKGGGAEADNAEREDAPHRHERGPVDFKVSFGRDITLIEVKLTTNSQYSHGYEVQLEEYGKAEQTNSLIYVLIDLGNPGKVKKVQECHDQRYNSGENPPDLIVIDGRETICQSTVTSERFNTLHSQ